MKKILIWSLYLFTSLLSAMPLHDAAEKGDVEAVRKLIKDGAYIEHTTLDFIAQTALHLAAHNGHPKVVRVLLDEGANKDAKDRNGHTPLHWAAIGGHPEVARLLLKSGADTEVTNRWGQSPLHEAAHFNKEKIAMILLESGANTKATDHKGLTPLHEAAIWANRGGYDKVVRGLCIWGADPTNIKSNHPDSQRILSRYQGQQSPKEIEYLRELYKKHGTTEAVRTAIVTLTEAEPKTIHRLLYWLGDEVEEIEHL